ncbi:Conserved_hypothetical protein [Hexamita inflata]|uniref:MORN repeat protein n=1 Tax=Hexamita inflata TaxID=28002 RepID=A0AA86QIW8_9EUKA|nr:Conserved hypothetical protein [Hexamita inflata]
MNLNLSRKNSNCKINETEVCMQYWGWYQNINNNDIPYFGVVKFSNFDHDFYKYIGKIGLSEKNVLIPEEIGIFYYHNGGTYNGSILHGLKHGHGVYVSSNGNIYNGTWGNDQFIQGTITNATREEEIINWPLNYQQYFSYNLGIKKQINGDYYAGELFNNKYHGEGILNYKNGSNYTGNFSNGQCNGQGSLELVNGDFYTGNWKNNQKSGYGTYSFSGNKYIGDFSEDLTHGRGSVLYSNNDHYDGYWSEGNYHGRGTLIQYNGDSYTGNFKNGEYMSEMGN